MEDAVRVSLLGPFEVRSDDGSTPLAGVKLQTVLALLALTAPHVVSDDRLIEELWGADQPANPANALQALISHLRRLLGSDVIVRQGAGYLLRIDPDLIDAIRLARLVERGRAASAAGDHAMAADRFRAAVELVRGPPLVELVDNRCGEPELAAQWRAFVNDHADGWTHYDGTVMASARNHEGLTARANGDLQRAADVHARALEWYVAAGLPSGVAFTESCLGFLCAERGDLAGATRHHVAALAAATAAEDPAALALALEGCASVHTDPVASATLLGAASSLWAAAGPSRTSLGSWRCPRSRRRWPPPNSSPTPSTDRVGGQQRPRAPHVTASSPSPKQHSPAKSQNDGHDAWRHFPRSPAVHSLRRAGDRPARRLQDGHVRVSSNDRDNAGSPRPSNAGSSMCWRLDRMGGRAWSRLVAM